jgi:hypothetical protein
MSEGQWQVRSASKGEGEADRHATNLASAPVRATTRGWKAWQQPCPRPPQHARQQGHQPNPLLNGNEFMTGHCLSQGGSERWGGT